MTMRTDGSDTAPLRIGQIGTRHGHAAGKWRALASSPDVEAGGGWEADERGRGARQGHGA